MDIVDLKRLKPLLNLLLKLKPGDREIVVSFLNAEGGLGLANCIENCVFLNKGIDQGLRSKLKDSLGEKKELLRHIIRDGKKISNAKRDKKVKCRCQIKDKMRNEDFLQVGEKGFGVILETTLPLLDDFLRGKQMN